jgi:alkylhydroperoxidase family enzyme
MTTRPGPDPDLTVRLAPLERASLGPVARVAASVSARATRTPAPRVVTTLARHRRLFRRWLPLATGLLRGDLAGPERELVILRTAWCCDAWYEWCQHVALAEREGLRPDDIARVTAGPSAPGWTARQRLLLTATDELHDRRVVSDGTWDALARELTADQIIELCFLVGHYEMVAMALNTLGVEPEPTARARLTGAAAVAAGDLRAGLAAARRRDPVTPR